MNEGRPFIRVVKSKGKHYLSVVFKFEGGLRTIKSLGRPTKESWKEAIELLLPCIKLYEQKRAKRWFKEHE